MRTVVLSMMLLVFVMGLGFTTAGHLSKKHDADPWSEVDNHVRSSKHECEGDPWSELNKGEASQKEIRAVEWAEDNV